MCPAVRLDPSWRCVEGFVGVARAGLGVVLAEELRRLGRSLRKPGFLKDRRDSGSEVKLCQPASSQSKIAQTRSLSFGSRKTCDPLQPCCFRFSAPLVEKVFQKRSKSSIFAVARTIVSSSAGTCCCAVHPTPLRKMERGSQPTSGRVRNSRLGDRSPGPRRHAECSRNVSRTLAQRAVLCAR